MSARRGRAIPWRERLTRGCSLLALAGLLWIGARGVDPLPPLGPLLDPVRGLWALAASAEFPARAAGRLQGLAAPVRVVYDDRGVPHIFATTERDAIHALGYVTARDRLFQLDLQARAGGGTLTELLGPPALDQDRETRRLGMARAAERLAAALPDTGESRATLDAYAAGVNAYLDAMPARELPLEYRLLGRRPARWSALRTIHVVLRMGYTLTQNSTEIERERAAAAVGAAAADALFPLHSPLQEPIQPSPGSPRRLRIVIPPPGAPDSVAQAVTAPIAGPRLSHGPQERDARGSNNWAIAPRRTRAGAALLASDPHLDLTLPSIWYEAHLSVPGALDVYGITVPGLPAILMGFNRDLAWSFTNVEADLMDRWLEEVDDTVRPRRYRLDGTWAAIEERVETYRGRRAEVVAVDTLRFNHRGPMRKVGRRWLSTRWSTLESPVETAAFHRAARARTAVEWHSAMASYQSPPQTMLVADRQGTIAVRSTGRFPIRGGDGRGDVLRDGTTRSTDWTGYWSAAELPMATDPPQGFLASANQEPQHPRDQTRYLGGNWIPPWRALRINALLRADSRVTPATMRRWQTDPASTRADFYVPYMLRAARLRPTDTTLAHASRVLAGWDRRYTRDAQGAVLFEAAMTAASTRLWDELPAGVRPGGGAFISLLGDPANAWWNVVETPAIERRDDLLADALTDGYAAVVRAHGPPESGAWRWSAVHRIDIWHLLRLPAASRLDLDVAGGPSTISPSSAGASAGSSWRMVVELGPEVRGWGTYPGGQSGNPASRRYADGIQAWQQGRLDELRFPRSADAVAPSSELLLRPAP